MKNILAVLFFLSMTGTNHAAPVFHWKWQQSGNEILITGQFDNEAAVMIHNEATIIKKRFALLYRIIDEIEYSRLPIYRLTADTLSRELIAPFDAHIRKCGSIVIEIDSSLINFPIEFLKLGSQPIGIIRPLVFVINGIGARTDPGSIQLHKGFIVRDPTADPENACRTVYQLYPTSEFRSAYTITEKDLVIKPSTDFILISAHGDADSLTFRGGIALNKIDNMDPGFLEINDPGIVYIDGCQQGMNLTYIAALARTAKTNYYLGPIISNDSGESSTKTINWFFQILRYSKDPVTSIWKTRNKLFNHYNGRIKQTDVINKSFIFRIYKL